MQEEARPLMPHVEPDPRSVEARAARYDPFARYPADHPHAGAHVSREATCPCGRTFEQLQLAPVWRELVDRRGAGAQAALAREAPDGWVPRLCARCERAALAADSPAPTPPPPCADRAARGDQVDLGL